MHWLENAAARAGIPGAKTVNIPTNASRTAAWEQLVRVLRLSERALAERVAPVLRVPLANLDNAEAKAARLVPEKLAKKHGIYPLRETDRELIVASSEPQDYEAERDIGFASGRRITFELAGPATIEAALK